MYLTPFIRHTPSNWNGGKTVFYGFWTGVLIPASSLLEVFFSWFSQSYKTAQKQNMLLYGNAAVKTKSLRWSLLLQPAKCFGRLADKRNRKGQRLWSVKYRHLEFSIFSSILIVKYKIILEEKDWRHDIRLYIRLISFVADSEFQFLRRY